MDPRLKAGEPLPAITVSAMGWAQRHKRDGFDAIISIQDITLHNGVRFHSEPHPDHLVLRFADMDRAGPAGWEDHPELRLATAEHVEAALSFARGRNALLVHCHAGVSRSTAMTCAILAERLGPGREAEAVEQTFIIRNIAVPNLHIIGLADAILGREGRLLAALESYEQQHLPGNNDLRLMGRAAHFRCAGVPQDRWDIDVTLF